MYNQARRGPKLFDMSNLLMRCIFCNFRTGMMQATLTTAVVKKLLAVCKSRQCAGRQGSC